ncbi:MAG: ribonuclease D [Wenzhouxiangella sp.]|nr:MAG: ribonuclease D [Wenzhouxiangella sp.]
MAREAKLLNPEPNLEEAALHWAKTTTIGLDTEFVRERTFFPRPGLVQICDGQKVWLLDVAQAHPLGELGQMLERRETIKILHSVGEDLEIFRILTGKLPRPLFDTQIAAAMLGLPLQVRYENLVEHCFSVTLPGGKARSDWCKRPLAPELLDYAAQDVIWLPRLQAHLSEALEARDRLAWLEEDCQRLVDRAEHDGPTDQSLARVKGAGRLEDPALAWLATLVTWRDQQARERDLPRSFVVRDEALIEIAHALAGSGVQEAALSALPAGLRRRQGKQLLEQLDEIGPAENFERPAELNALSPEQRTWLKAAQQVVRQQAEALEIDPALIASKRELTRLVRGEQPDWLSGWRGEVLSDLPEL